MNWERSVDGKGARSRESGGKTEVKRPALGRIGDTKETSDREEMRRGRGLLVGASGKKHKGVNHDSNQIEYQERRRQQISTTGKQ